MFVEIDGVVLWLVLWRVFAMLLMLVNLPVATLGSPAYTDCASTAQADMAIRSRTVRQELLVEKIFTIAPLMT